MLQYAIEIQNVTKKFKNALALNTVSVNFESGKIHGVIGRNGSGKTVLFKCICGFLQPTLGRILVRGKQVEHGKQQDIGIIIEDPGFVGSLNAFKNLKLLASIKKKIDDEQIREYLKLVGLEHSGKKHVRNFSLGMRHRLGIAQAIMENPPILILDEPMNGLDKQGVLDVRDILKELNQRGTTIILSSHYAEDIEVLCHTVSEMDGGVLIRVR